LQFQGRSEPHYADAHAALHGRSTGVDTADERDASGPSELEWPASRGLQLRRPILLSSGGFAVLHGWPRLQALREHLLIVELSLGHFEISGPVVRHVVELLGHDEQGCPRLPISCRSRQCQTLRRLGSQFVSATYCCQAFFCEASILFRPGTRHGPVPVCTLCDKLIDDEVFQQFESGHCEIQNRPRASETGRYPDAPCA
jgi:hypothetical protein